MVIISHAPPRVNNNGGIIMTAKQELIEFIKNMTPEQVEKVVSRLDLLERCLTMTDAEAIYTDTFTSRMFGGTKK